jgi:hypothetical protein
MKNIKYSIIGLLLGAHFSKAVPLTITMLDQIIEQKALKKQNLSNSEKRIIDLVSSIKHNMAANKDLWLTNFRASRWDNNKLKNQKSILEHESYVWQAGNSLPIKWPSMIHRFSKNIDQDLLKLGYFSIYQNPENPHDKNNVSVVVPAIVYLTNQNNNDLHFPCMVEYGFDRNNVCFHRCVRGLGWKNFENSFSSVRHLAGETNGKLDWDYDKFSGYKIFDNEIETDKMKVQVFQSFEARKSAPKSQN